MDDRAAGPPARRGDHLTDTARRISLAPAVDLADVVTHVVGQSSFPVEFGAEEAWTAGDALLLERLVHNLVENAVRYNVPDGWVRVTSRTAGDRVELTVSNTGPVVPPYEVPALFEPFRRLADRPASPSGAGLGLSIVRSWPGPTAATRRRGPAGVWW